MTCKFTTKIMATLNDANAEQAVACAADILRQGGIVAIPTETVYGLAASAFDEQAVEKIFLAKGRPQDNPLIVHVCDEKMAETLVTEIPETAHKLFRAFSPGPLTVILKKSSKIPMCVSGGLDTVAIRIPSHKIAREIIRKAGLPLAAPSANLSGSPSPTSAFHVAADMNGRIPLIVDAGDCGIGVESTVVSVVGKQVTLLRPGFVTAAEIQQVAGNITIDDGVLQLMDDNREVRSPGMKYKHYSPKAEVILVDGALSQFVSFIEQKKEEGVFVLCFDKEAALFPVPCICYGEKEKPETQTKRLFAALREIDAQGAAKVYARCPQKDGVGLAVYNRLLRAAAFQVVRL